MGAKGELIVPGQTIVQALPFQHNTTGYMDQIWKYRRKLKLSAPVTREVAKAHAELTQDICCVVRQKPNGPRGGQGEMHYNGEPRFGEWWPAAWSHVPKGYRFYLVVEVVEQSHYEKVQRGAVAGLVIDESSEFIS